MSGPSQTHPWHPAREPPELLIGESLSVPNQGTTQRLENEGASLTPAHPNETRRQELLDRIEEIFLAEGFLHTRVGTLADRLHCSRSTLYKLAPSKTELYVLILDRWLNKATDQVLEATRDLDTPIQKIETAANLTAELQSQVSPEFWRDARSFGPTAERFSEGQARGIRRIRSYLDEGVESGFFHPANTAFVAYVIWLGVNAARDPDLTRRLGLDQEAATRELGALVLRGMRARS